MVFIPAMEDLIIFFPQFGTYEIADSYYGKECLAKA
jgi:hypothetical protein